LRPADPIPTGFVLRRAIGQSPRNHQFCAGK
jgi:hypothetical protein